MHTERKAILWGGNPIDFGLLGSPMTHAGFLECYDSVVWDIYFPNADLKQFDFPISGYIYTTDFQKVTYRARILDMRHGFPADFRDSIPPWRNIQNYTRDLTDYVSILIDQLDLMHPKRELKEFIKMDGTQVEAPPRAKYTVVKDPLF